MTTSTERKQIPSMVTKKLTVHFNTPAFLGDAEQKGRWRSPPFKHLLREWWRVAWAEANNPTNWVDMRHQEALLFGHAWLENDVDSRAKPVPGRKSSVLLRLKTWKRGKLETLPKTRAVAARAPSSTVYLGYGPVTPKGSLKHPPALAAKDRADLLLAYSPHVETSDLLPRALELMHLYGTIGGRSRNGWGSLHLSSDVLQNSTPPVSDWQKCLQQEWPHAIGNDHRGPLIWSFKSSHSRWEDVIKELGALRKQVNTLAKDKGKRPYVNQPVAGRGGRLPNSLRFKVRQDKQGRLYGVVYHMPCTPSSVAGIHKNGMVDIWSKIYEYLDGLKSILERSKK